MSRYFLGVDIGNTKSHAIIADETGKAVGIGVTGPGNHEVLGVDGFRNALHEVVNRAVASAGIRKDQIVGAGYGIAGYDWPSDRPLMDKIIATLGLHAAYDCVNDSVPGLIAGATHGWGVSVSAGTSCNCHGRDQKGKMGRVTGNGWYFGEYGGGVELVVGAIQAISRAWSLRGPETLLSKLMVDHTGAKDVTDLLEGIARGRYHVSAVDAPVVFQAVEQNDPVARDLLLWISRELGNLAIGVVRQLAFESLEFEVVMAGSFYKGSPVLIAETMRETIHQVAPGAKLVRLEAPPVVGSVLLGMEQAGVDFIPMRQTLIATANQLLSQED